MVYPDHGVGRLKDSDRAEIARLMDEGASVDALVAFAARSCLSEVELRKARVKPPLRRQVVEYRGFTLSEGEVSARLGVNRAAFNALYREGLLQPL